MLSPQAAADVGALVAHARLAEVERSARCCEANLRASHMQRRRALARASELERDLDEAERYIADLERGRVETLGQRERAAALEADRDEAQARAEDAERGWVSARDQVDRLEQEVADWRVTWDTERRHRNRAEAETQEAERERDEARAALAVMHQVAEVRLSRDDVGFTTAAALASAPPVLSNPSSMGLEEGPEGPKQIEEAAPTTSAEGPEWGGPA